MGKEVLDDACVSIDSVDDVSTPIQTRTWGNDIVEAKSRSWIWTWGIRDHWSSACRMTGRTITGIIGSAERTMQPTLNAVWPSVRRNFWPMVVRVSTAKKQWFALFTFLCCAVAPMVTLGYFTPRPEFEVGTWPPYYNVFSAKTMTCGNQGIDDYPANSTIKGIEGLFVLDQTWGPFAFSTVKTIDTAWDIIIGHGVQMLAWWTAYIVFSDALLRMIERHPASFRIFQRIALEGPSLLALWTLCKELLSVRSKRTKMLFTYMLLATSYVLCIPMFLGAMTGYDSTAIAWVDIDNSNNIVPASALKEAWVISGTANSTFDQKVCTDPDNAKIQHNYFAERVVHCECQMLNGTLAPPGTFNYNDAFGLYSWSVSPPTNGTICLFNFKGSTETWEEQQYIPRDGLYKNVTRNCNETVTLKVNEQTYDIQNLNGSYMLCYNHEAYDQTSLAGKTRCLPDTASPSYQWGFSTMLSGIFVFLHFAWCASMYIVWLDAQSRSTLIKEGYKMTPLRAAFAIAKAVKRKTGLGEKQLVRHDTKDLNKALYGAGKAKGADIEYSIFVVNTEEDAEKDKMIRKRRALTLDGLPS